MNKYLIVFMAEFRKSKKNFYGRFSSIISSLIWPILSFSSILLTYASFHDYEQLGVKSYSEFIILIITGFAVYSMFWSIMSSSVQIRYERQNGTLENIFLTPANKLVLFYGRTFGGIFFNMWMFIVFSVVVVLLNTTLTLSVIFSTFLIFLLILVGTVVWGGFITSLFLISRDSNILFGIFDGPMNFFTGTQFPISFFSKFVIYGLSSFFPASYCIDFLRSALLDSYVPVYKIESYIILLIILIILTILILKIVEKKSRKNNSFQLF